MAKKKAKAKAKKRVAKKRVAKKKAGGRGRSGLTSMTYHVSSELQAVIGAKTATRPMIVKKLWVYIKSKRLQDPKHRRMIVPDSKLASVFGSSRPVDMLKMSGLLNKHIKKH